MQPYRLIRLPTALVVAGLLFVASAGADTIATFADPAPGGDGRYLFELTDSTLRGGWADPGLDLITPITGGLYEDATFTMTDLGVDESGLTSAGTIWFFESGGELILQIDFDAGQLYMPFGFGAMSLIEGHNVRFSGPIITMPLVEESFAFSFANQVSTPLGFTWTAAFTSSAIPEPGALVLLGLGSAVLITARRRV
ncbi:MAG: PEP-CTERM sorting domain-containing protein [Planctomycetes bacterium]|nr:PEP-CTERM sorting domain-containing protein [Planctomycetota bacterium]